MYINRLGNANWHDSCTAAEMLSLRKWPVIGRKWPINSCACSLWVANGYLGRRFRPWHQQRAVFATGEEDRGGLPSPVYPLPSLPRRGADLVTRMQSTTTVERIRVAWSKPEVGSLEQRNFLPHLKDRGVDEVPLQHRKSNSSFAGPPPPTCHLLLPFSYTHTRVLSTLW